MKKKLLNIAFAMTAVSSSIYSQITIGNVEKNETKQIVNAPKPKTLDSLSDFQVEAWWMNYKQYYGDYHFYLPPQIGNSYPVLFNTEAKQAGVPLLWSTNPKKADTPFDNYYRLIGWVTDSILKSSIKDNKIYYYHTENFTPVSPYPNLFEKMYFVMKNKKDGDTLYWSPNDNKEFILVPYFVKQKALYEKKVFYSESYAELQEKDINTKDFIYINQNSKWTCKEVTLLKNSQVFDIRADGINDRYAICYVFVNEKNQTFAKTLNPIYPETRISRNDYNGKFLISEKEFINKQNTIKKEEQISQLKSEARDIKQKQNLNTKKTMYVSKYGQANADLIINGKVKLGFTKEMCIDAWGGGFNRTQTTNSEGEFETWVYTIKQILHFKNNTLIQIEL